MRFYHGVKGAISKSISRLCRVGLAGASMGRSNDTHDKRWNIDTMYYDGHSEVESAAI